MSNIHRYIFTVEIRISKEKRGLLACRLALHFFSKMLMMNIVTVNALSEQYYWNEFYIFCRKFD